MNKVIQIRLANRRDIPILERLISESVRQLSKGYYSEKQIEAALLEIFGVDTQLIDDGTYFVAESMNQIVGCGGWSKRKTLYGCDQLKEAKDPLLDPESEPARIRAFFVHPSWARRGIATQIMKACERAASEASFKELELAATLPGEPLYRAFGYEVVENMEAPLSDGEKLPVIRMRKQIN
jgi:N-acetylglutamate synthase-like GNAT family acetyltransferase